MKLTYEELRIGNLVKFSDKSIEGNKYSSQKTLGLFKIAWIVPNGIRVVNFYDETNSHSSISLENGLIEGIPLSEIWLFKLGFIPYRVDENHSLIGSHDYYSNIRDAMILLKQGDELFPMIKVNDNNLSPIGKGLKFVHELQNVTYALNGREMSDNP